MKKVIRFNTFETISSSVCSLVCFNDEEYKKWCDGKHYFQRFDFETYNPELKTKEELVAEGCKPMSIGGWYSDSYEGYAPKYEEEDGTIWYDEDCCWIPTENFGADLEVNSYTIVDEDGKTKHIEVATGYDG